MNSLGATHITDSTKKHMRRNLEAKFGSLLQFEDLLYNNKLFVLAENLSKIQLAKDLAKHAVTKIQQIQQARLHARDVILSYTIVCSEVFDKQCQRLIQMINMTMTSHIRNSKK